MKKWSNNPFLVIVAWLLVVVYGLVTHITLANAIFLLVPILIFSYLGNRKKDKK